jgi:hypothetical protein
MSFMLRKRHHSLGFRGWTLASLAEHELATSKLFVRHGEAVLRVGIEPCLSVVICDREDAVRPRIAFFVVTVCDGELDEVFSALSRLTSWDLVEFCDDFWARVRRSRHKVGRIAFVITRTVLSNMDRYERESVARWFQIGRNVTNACTCVFRLSRRTSCKVCSCSDGAKREFP